jgi:hypothetical protein
LALLGDHGNRAAYVRAGDLVDALWQQPSLTGRRAAGSRASFLLWSENFRSCFHAHGNSGSATAVWCGKMTGSRFFWVRSRFEVRAVLAAEEKIPGGDKNFATGGVGIFF